MHSIFSILLFCFATAFTPGPNNLMLMNSGLTYGIKRSLPHCFGVALGFPIMVFLVALGAGSLFIKHPWIHDLLKILGILYMLYLAWKIANSHPHLEGKSRSGKPLTFLQAALFQWVNPKAWAMAIGVISIFTVASQHLWYQAVEIPLLFLLACVPSALTWLLFGGAMQRFLKKDAHIKKFNYAMAICLVLSIIILLIE